MTNISWKLEANVSDGPSHTLSQSVSVEAYDKVQVELPDTSATPAEVEIEIGAGTGDVLFLLVTASEYGSDLKYKVNATANPSHALDGPLHLAGDGAIGLLGFAPTSLLFTNTLGSNATVEILVGRDATP